MIRSRTPFARVVRPSFRPRCEPLEDRLAPAVHTWTGAVSSTWSNPDNWIGGSPEQDPQATLVFPASPTRHTSENTIPTSAAFEVRSISIQGTGYNISGNRIKLASTLGITANNATGVNNFACDITTPRFVQPTVVTVTNAGATLNLTGRVSGGYQTIRLTKAGAGTLGLFGDNIYDAGTQLNAGTIVVGSNTALGLGPLTLNGGSLRASTPVTLANLFAVAGFASIGGNQNMTFNGAGDLGVNLTTNNAAGSTLRFNGPLSGPAGVRTNGAGTVVLANSANSYQGTTQVFNGMLRLGTNNVIPNASPVVVNITGDLETVSYDDVIGSLAGSGTVTVGTVGSTLVTGGLNTSTTFSGSLSGAGLVRKDGTGTWTLTGPYTVSRTWITAGTLDVRTIATVDQVNNMGGTVLVDADGFVSVTGNYVQSAGRTTLNGSGIAAALVDLQGGTLSGSGYIVGNLRNDGTITVGGANAAGYLYVFGGNYTQTVNGILNVELAGPDIVTQYDFFYVEGTASLAGRLNVTRLSGYVPNPDDYFLPLYSDGLTTGTFGTITGLPLGGGRELLPIYFDNGLFLWAT